MNNGYIEVKRYGNDSSFIYLHVVVAERKIGRRLKKGECVHHVDMNKTNNDPDNLIVFKTARDHSLFHSLKDKCSIKITDDGSYVCVRNEGKNEFQFDTCSNIKGSCLKIFNFCTLDDLVYSLLRLSFVEVAKSFDISDNMLRKICIKFGIEHKSSYYRKKACKLGIPFHINN